MKIKQAVSVNKIKNYEDKLRSFPMIVLNTLDHLEHIAAFLAWQSVGGNVAIINPALDKASQAQLLVQANAAACNVKNKLFFHTTGTTGQPKLVVHGERQVSYSASQEHLFIDDSSAIKFLNFLPASSVGFWFVAMASIIKNDGEISFITKENLRRINEAGANCSAIPPSVINLLSAEEICPDLSKFNLVITGASKVEHGHIETLFSWGVPITSALYGSTECGVPLVFNRHTCFNELADCYEFNAAVWTLSGSNELMVSGESICDNHIEFGSVNGYIPSGDIFEMVGDHIRFRKRKNAEKVSSCSKYSL